VASAASFEIVHRRVLRIAVVYDEHHGR
jgi:hypothetical protein